MEPRDGSRPDGTLLVETNDDGDGVGLEISGELDYATAPKLASVVEEALGGEPHDLRLDLSGLRFVDSSGIRALLVVADRCSREGHALRLLDVGAEIQRRIEGYGIADRFQYGCRS
jgi:anti-sigma B factor antagonist